MNNKITFEVDQKGNKIWKLNGLFHCEDGPALISPNGTEQWFIKGKIHRDGNEPAVIYKNGNKAWYKNGFLHREDGPAIIMNNGEIQEWFLEGKQHRLDGPAIIRKNKEEYWINGVEITKEEFNIHALVKDLSEELTNNDTDKKKLKI